MAFIPQNLGSYANAASNGESSSLWRYNTSDDLLAAIIGAGYFADAGNDTGDERLNNGDVIIAQDSAGVVALLKVTDADAGTAATIASL